MSDDVIKRASALRLWEEARPIAGTLAARYLADIRGIDSPRCPPASTTCCAFIRAARSARAAAPLPHRAHAQRRDRRADRNPPHRLTPEARKIERWMLGNSGVVKLWPAGTQLVVGEGPRDRARCRHANSLRRQAVAAGLGGALGRHAGRLSGPQRRRTVDRSGRPRRSRIDCRSDLRIPLDPRRTHRRAADARASRRRFQRLVMQELAL